MSALQKWIGSESVWPEDLENASEHPASFCSGVPDVRINSSLKERFSFKKKISLLPDYLLLPTEIWLKSASFKPLNTETASHCRVFQDLSLVKLGDGGDGGQGGWGCQGCFQTLHIFRRADELACVWRHLPWQHPSGSHTLISWIKAALRHAHTLTNTD